MHGDIASKLAFAGRFVGGALPTYMKWLTRARKGGNRCIYAGIYLGMIQYWVDAKDRRYTLPPFRERKRLAYQRK